MLVQLTDSWTGTSVKFQLKTLDLTNINTLNVQQSSQSSSSGGNKNIAGLINDWFGFSQPFLSAFSQVYPQEVVLRQIESNWFPTNTECKLPQLPTYFTGLTEPPSARCLFLAHQCPLTSIVNTLLSFEIKQEKKKSVPKKYWYLLVYVYLSNTVKIQMHSR